MTRVAETVQSGAPMKHTRKGPKPALVGKTDAARILGISIWRMRRYLKANPGFLPGRVRVGKGRYLWRRVEVEAFARAAATAEPQK